MRVMREDEHFGREGPRTFSGLRAGATRAMTRPKPPILTKVAAMSICSTMSCSSCVDNHQRRAKGNAGRTRG